MCFFKHFVLSPVSLSSSYHDTNPHQILHRFQQIPFPYHKYNMTRLWKKPSQNVFCCHLTCFVHGLCSHEFVQSFETFVKKLLIGIWVLSVSDCVKSIPCEKIQRQLLLHDGIHWISLFLEILV